MREIKFRAWDKIARRMYEVALIDFLNREVVLAIPEIPELGRMAFKDIVLMQYTGLKDKNGVEIYEGDIVIDWEGIDRYTVVWNKKWACFELKRLTKNNDTDVEIDGLMSCEVIGNIFENTELLKGEER